MACFAYTHYRYIYLPHTVPTPYISAWAPLFDFQPFGYFSPCKLCSQFFCSFFFIKKKIEAQLKDAPPRLRYYTGKGAIGIFLAFKWPCLLELP